MHTLYRVHPTTSGELPGPAAPSGSYDWNVDAPERLAQAQAATQVFFSRIATLNYRLAVLLSAREGTLTPDWREALAAGEDSVADKEDEGAGADGAEVDADSSTSLTDDQRDACRRAAEAIAASPPAQWHPHSDAGWRLALDAWFDAIKACLDDIERAEMEVRRQSWMAVDGVAARIGMDRDLATASYRAGLAAGGLDVDWYEWLVDRVRLWPDKQRRDAQLDLMTLEPGYRDSMQHLPSHWA